MIQYKIQVLEVANDTKFLDGNIGKVEYDAKKEFVKIAVLF